MYAIMVLQKCLKEQKERIAFLVNININGDQSFFIDSEIAERQGYITQLKEAIKKLSKK
jgi:hypothetical protein